MEDFSVREKDLEGKYLWCRRTGGNPGRRVFSLARRLACSSASDFSSLKYTLRAVTLQ